MISLQGIEKYYGQKPVLSIPELKLEKGIYWIKGENGSGKTTLLKIIAGLVPFNGEVFINNTSLKKQPAGYRKLVSYSEAEPLYPSFITGSNLLYFYRDIRKAPIEQINRLVSFSGLEQNLNSPIGTYSSGMVKRLSLMLVLTGPVSLVLLDEPLATLDREATAALPGLIQEYREVYGTSFIFSSHQPFLPASMLNGELLITGQTIQPIA